MTLTKNKKIFVSDCEGPISKNDNAFELAAHFIPNGDKLFTIISKYDDVLADIVKKPNYKAGDTLKLILPFLKAYGATNAKIREYSAENILLVPGAKDMLQFVKNTMPSFIVSTSYEHYVKALCELTNFPYTNVYCTRLDIDKYDLTEEEEKELRHIANEIAAMPMIRIPKNAESISKLSEKDQETIRQLDEIFWNKISKMECGKMLKEVSPIGGEEKANAIRDILQKRSNHLESVMYVGDSITDMVSFQLVRKNGGLTISFNGNEYAIREAEIAVLSENAIVTSVLADVFNKSGKEGVLQLVEEWSHITLEKLEVNPGLRSLMRLLYPKDLPKVEIVTAHNKERLSRESSVFRKKVRGEVIGRLG